MPLLVRAAKDSPHRPVTSSSILLTECPKRPYTTHICAVRFLQLTLIGCPTAATSQRQVRISNHKRACVPLAGQLMALNKPTIAGHQRPLPPQSNSLTAFHRTVVSRRVPVAGARGPFETTSHSVWSTTFIRSSFIRPPYTSILERAVSISRRSAGVS